MNTPKNIDELLKQEFDGFAPDAPDVWSGIEQSMPSASASTGGASAGGSVVKTTLLSGKWLLVAAVVATTAAVITYGILQQEESPKTDATENSAVASMPTENTEQMNQTVETKEEAPVTEEIPNRPEESITVQPTPRKETKSNKANRKPKVEKASVSQANELKENPRSEQPQSEKSVTENQQPIKTPQPESKEATPKAENEVTHENQVANQNANAEPAHTENKPEQFKGPLDQMEEASYKPRIPNTFTPDGNLLNEFFKIEIENEASYYIMILDRKGRIVFESDRKDLMWNGQNYKNGEECPEGVYVYTFRYKLNGAQKEFTKSGKIYLYR